MTDQTQAALVGAEIDIEHRTHRILKNAIFDLEKLGARRASYGGVLTEQGDYLHLTLTTGPQGYRPLADLQPRDGEGERLKALQAAIIQDICELPGDDDVNADDTLILSLDDLTVILDRNLDARLATTGADDGN